MSNIKLICTFLFFGIVVFQQRAVATTAADNVRWVDSTKVDISSLEPAGVQILDGVTSTLYVVRAQYRLLFTFAPGRYSDVLQKGWFSYRGDEIEITGYHEFLTFPPGSVSWVESNAQLPPPSNLIFGGEDPELIRDVWLCRVWHDGENLIPGKFVDIFRTCVYTFDGQEHEGHQYELLVLNAYGQAIKAGNGTKSEM